MCICVYTYVHAILVNEKRSHEFGGEQERLYWKGFKGEKEGRNVVITVYFPGQGG